LPIELYGLNPDRIQMNYEENLINEYGAYDNILVRGSMLNENEVVQ
jgi:hypothetical protein